MVHAPPPWKTIKYRGAYGYETTLVDKNGMHICYIDEGPGQSLKAAANLELIAKAPELFTLLKSLCEVVIDADPSYYLDTGKTKQQINAALKLIAQIE